MTDYLSQEAIQMLEEIEAGEPRWTLHIRFIDGSNPKFYRALSMDALTGELRKWNRHYKLWPDRVEDAWDCRFIWIMAERRDKGCQTGATGTSASGERTTES